MRGYASEGRISLLAYHEDTLRTTVVQHIEHKSFAAYALQWSPVSEVGAPDLLACGFGDGSIGVYDCNALLSTPQPGPGDGVRRILDPILVKPSTHNPDSEPQEEEIVPNTLAWKLDGTSLLAGFNDGSIACYTLMLYWEGSSGRMEFATAWSTQVHTGAVLGLEWVDEKRLISTGADGGILIRDIRDPTTVLSSHFEVNSWMTSISCISREHMAFAIGSDTGVVKLIHVLDLADSDAGPEALPSRLSVYNVPVPCSNIRTVVSVRDPRDRLPAARIDEASPAVLVYTGASDGSIHEVILSGVPWRITTGKLVVRYSGVRRIASWAAPEPPKLAASHVNGGEPPVLEETWNCTIHGEEGNGGCHQEKTGAYEWTQGNWSRPMSRLKAKIPVYCGSRFDPRAQVDILSISSAATVLGVCSADGTLILRQLQDPSKVWPDYWNNHRFVKSEPVEEGDIAGTDTLQVQNDDSDAEHPLPKHAITPSARLDTQFDGDMLARTEPILGDGLGGRVNSTSGTIHPTGDALTISSATKVSERKTNAGSSETADRDGSKDRATRAESRRSRGARVKATDNSEEVLALMRRIDERCDAVTKRLKRTTGAPPEDDTSKG